MKLLFDQNISPKILKLLPKELSESQRVRFVDLEDSGDKEIFEFARMNNFTIVTFDPHPWSVAPQTMDIEVFSLVLSAVPLSLLEIRKLLG